MEYVEYLSVHDQDTNQHQSTKQYNWIVIDFASWFIQGGPPKRYKLVNITSMNYSYLHTINHSEIGVICTNLANELGPTL